MNRPLPPASGTVLPVVDRIQMRSVIKRSFRDDVVGMEDSKPIKGPVSDLPPDQAYADGSQVDLSRAFLPLGQSPRPDAAFYFSCEEAFSKPGAEVIVCFHKAETPEKEADTLK